MGYKLVGDWAAAKKLLDQAPKLLEKASWMALDQEGAYLEGLIVAGIGKNVAPLSPSTRAQRSKKGSRPLVNESDLRNSITHEVYGSAYGPAVFIGITRRSKAKNGQPMANLARVHEEGRTIVLKMTPKMRRFIHAVLPPQTGPALPSGKFSTVATPIVVINIPARPFIGPVFEKEKGKIRERLRNRIWDIFIDLIPASGEMTTALVSSHGAVPGAPAGIGAKAGKSAADRVAAAKKGWATRRAKAAAGGGGKT